MKIPLLIGGATTSKMHTAVKIYPEYENGVVHVLDASRSVVVAQNLSSAEMKEDYLEDINEEYKQLIDDFRSSCKERVFVTHETAKTKKLKLDFVSYKPHVPTIQGTIVLEDFPLKRLLQYIDWTPFFHTYQLRGRYPNRDYPKLFEDKRVGSEAKKLFDEAQLALEDIIEHKLLRASAVIGIWPCNSQDEDILIYTNDDRDTVAGVFHGLRQQEKNDEDIYHNISDFVAPVGVTNDYIAGFECTTGIGCEELIKKYKHNHELDEAIMVEALADRLAEAFAEYIHLELRRKLWGFSKNENFTTEELLKVQYQGVRPAPGYPTQPDHREKETLHRLLGSDKFGIKLTESYMMNPGASVSALVFAHPQSCYFSVGKLSQDQVENYSIRLGEKDTEQTEKWLRCIID